MVFQSTLELKEHLRNKEETLNKIRENYVVREEEQYADV